VAHYPLNGDTKDLSGNDNHGELVGAEFVFAGRAQALHVQGNTSSYMVVRKAAALEPAEAITISMWIKGIPGQAAGHGWGTLLRKAGGCQAGFHLRGGGITGLHLEGANPCGGGSKVSVAFRKFDASRWQHIVGTYSLQEGSVKCYQDGALVGEAAYRQPLSHSGDLFIGGANVAGDDGGFKGLICDLRIYNRLFTAAEVRAALLQGSPCQ
jgi:hypothetical protein